MYGSSKGVYGRVTGTGTSCSPPLHSSVREDYRSFRFAVELVFKNRSQENVGVEKK